MWLYELNDTTVGPVSEQVIGQLLHARVINSDTLVCRHGTVDWLPLGQASVGQSIPALGKASPPPLATAPAIKPPQKLQETKPAEEPVKPGEIILGLGLVAAAATLLVLGGFAIVGYFRGDSPAGSGRATPAPPVAASAAKPAEIPRQSDSQSVAELETKLQRQMEAYLTANKQKVFDSVHPIGTARSIKVHEVTITGWKGSRPSNRMEDVRQYDVRFTLHWEGPVNKDGYTNLNSTYDAEIGRFVRTQVLATNGGTNEDAGTAIRTAIELMMDYQAKKEGARQATEDYLQRQ